MIITPFSIFPSFEKLIISKQIGYLLDIKPCYVITQTKKGRGHGFCLRRHFRIQ